MEGGSGRRAAGEIAAWVVGFGEWRRGSLSVRVRRETERQRDRETEMGWDGMGWNVSEAGQGQDRIKFKFGRSVMCGTLVVVHTRAAKAARLL